MSIASLPWYDIAEIQPITDALWQRFAYWCRREGLVEVPDRLERTTHYESQWDQPTLLLSQACGYDVVLAHRGKLEIVVVPCYGAPGCEGGLYSSYVVVRDASRAESLSDLRGARCVINTRTSHSGMNILRAVIAPLHEEGRFFSQITVSGSHRRSLNRIRNKESDVAAIDCVTYALLERHQPEVLEGTRVLCSTPRVPAPPFVTSTHTSADDVQRLRAAFAHAMVDPQLDEVLRALFLEGVQVSHDAYWLIEDLEEEARRHGYQEIDFWVSGGRGGVVRDS